MSKVTMPHTYKALSAVLWIAALLMIVFLLRLMGCSNTNGPLAAADAAVSNAGSRYAVSQQNVGGVDGTRILDTKTGQEYVMYFRGHAAAITAAQAQT